MIWARSVNIFPNKRDNEDNAVISFNPKNRCESECVYTVCPKTGNLEKPFLCEWFGNTKKPYLRRLQPSHDFALKLCVICEVNYLFILLWSLKSANKTTLNSWQDW